jgi:hypothetical protein
MNLWLEAGHMGKVQLTLTSVFKKLPHPAHMPLQFLTVGKAEIASLLVI